MSIAPQHPWRPLARPRRNLVGLCLLLLAAGQAVGQPQGPPPARVVLEEARLEELAQLREVTAELRPGRSSRLAVEEQGLVVQADFDPGDRCEAGQVLVRLDDTLLALEAETAQAEIERQTHLLEQDQAGLEKAERDLARAQSLMARSIESERVRDDAETARKTAAAQVAQRQAELEAARVRLAVARERLAKLEVKAPFAGTVIARETEMGEWLRPGDPVAQVISLEQLEAWLDVPEQHVDQLRLPGAQVQLRCTPLDLEVTSRVASIVPRADPLSRLVPVRVVLERPDDRLLPGMSITALVPTGRRAPLLTVPKDAILRDEAGEFLYFDAGGRAQVARVRTSFAVGDRVALAPGGLSSGARVIIEGNERLFPGQPLQPVDPAPTQEDEAAGEQPD